MLQQVLEIFNIQPDYDLKIMAHQQTLSEITSKVILGLDTILQEEQPKSGPDPRRHHDNHGG